MQGKQQKAGKNLALEGNVYVSIRQRADQTVGFSATNGHVSAGRQPLGEKGTAPSLGQDRSKCSCTVEKQQQKQNKDSRPAAIPSKRDTGSFCNFFMKSIENYNAVCYNVLEQ